VETVKDTAKDVNQTVKATVDVVAEDAKSSEEALVADKNQVATDKVASGKYVETQTTYILVPVDKEQILK
jgi:stress response protein YsnF